MKKKVQRTKSGLIKSTRKNGDCGKISPERTQKILLAISKGATRELACNYAGIGYSTFCKWRIAYENGDERYKELFEGIKETEGKAALVWLDKIDKAMVDGVWQAAAWKLERRYHKHYSQNAQLLALAEDIAELKRLHGVKQDESSKKRNEEGNEEF